MNERDVQFLEDILEFSERAIRIVGERSFEAFVGDETILYGVRYCLMVVGEGASGLSVEARSLCPDIPWHQMIAMRHRLVHGYGAVTDRIVYDTAKEDLLLLMSSVRAALAGSRGGGGEA